VTFGAKSGAVIVSGDKLIVSLKGHYALKFHFKLIPALVEMNISK